MEEIEYLKEKLNQLEKQVEELLIQVELLKLKRKSEYNYSIQKENPFSYNQRDFT